MKQKTPKAKCLNPAFIYTPSHSTNIRKRFRAELKRLRELETARATVTTLKRVAK